jgi:hypothetical protein
MRLLLKTLLSGFLLSTIVMAGDLVAVTDTASKASVARTVTDTAASTSDSITRQSAIADTTVAGAVAAQPDPVLHPAAVKKVESPAATPERTSMRKIKLIKREYNYRQQVVLAVGMMAFIAIMMSTAQSWNPK